MNQFGSYMINESSDMKHSVDLGWIELFYAISNFLVYLFLQMCLPESMFAWIPFVFDILSGSFF